jgi:hypothetical protein
LCFSLFSFRQSISFSLATIHTHSQLYSKTISPTTPSYIHTTLTCSQVWERLASHEQHQNSTSRKSITTSSTSTLPPYISFLFDPSDDDEEEDTFTDQNQEDEEQEITNAVE